MDQPGKVANPTRGQLNRENNIPLSPCVPENLYVCMYVCMYVFIKLHITAQSGPVIYSFYATACNPPGGYLS